MDLAPQDGSHDSADLVQPFVLEVAGLRGRLVRLGPLADTILGRHDYPEIVAAYLAEMLALATLLSSMLKFDGVFTLQTKTDGPVGMMVVDLTSDGAVRGYADFDAERVAALSDSDAKSLPVSAVLGTGYLAFTVDQGAETERYQGIVELLGETLGDCLQHYFRQSEQLKTALVLAAGQVEGQRRAGGLLLQQLPEDDPLAAMIQANDEEENWRRAVILMASCSEAELLDPVLSPHELLYRLFHEERVRVFEPRALDAGCRCSRERIERILSTLPRDEVLSMKVEGEVTMTCQFCNVTYRFDQAALDQIYDS